MAYIKYEKCEIFVNDMCLHMSISGGDRKNSILWCARNMAVYDIPDLKYFLQQNVEYLHECLDEIEEDIKSQDLDKDFEDNPMFGDLCVILESMFPSLIVGDDEINIFIDFLKNYF